MRRVFVCMMVGILSAVLISAISADQIREVPADQIMQENGIKYEKGSDIPFTGNMVRTYDDGRKTLTEFKDGKGNGLTVMWYANGQKAVEGMLVDDMPNGVLTRWDEEGNVVSQMVFDHGEIVEQ